MELECNYFELVDSASDKLEDDIAFFKFDAPKF